jgi:chemotaxis regulatin CheY-phosphate phosphatase CheZ
MPAKPETRPAPVPPPSTEDGARVHAALTRAVTELDAAVHEQELAATRILGLAELLLERTADTKIRLQIEAIMEACAFQDLTGQRLRKVQRLIRYLRDHKLVKAGDLPKEETGPRADGLNQAQVDALLAGKRI